MDNDPLAPKTVKVEKKRRRRRGSFMNVILIIAVIAVIGLFTWAEMRRRAAQEELKHTAAELEQLRESSQATGQEVARKVLEEVGKLIELPTDPTPTVATIIDIDALREANAFYEQAKNGDHLIITTDRAILFAPDRNLIIDVVPVSVRNNENGSPSPSPTASPSPVSETTPSPQTTAAP